VGAAAALGEIYLFAQMVNHQQRGKPQSAFLPRPSKAESCKNQPYMRRMTAACALRPGKLHSFCSKADLLSKAARERAVFLEEQYHPLFKLLYIPSISATAQLFKTSLWNYVRIVAVISASFLLESTMVLVLITAYVSNTFIFHGIIRHKQVYFGGKDSNWTWMKYCDIEI
jgi:hypothetical protein